MTLTRPQRTVTLLLSAVSAFILFQSTHTAPNFISGIEGIRETSILGKGAGELANAGRDAKALGSTRGLGGINDASHLGAGAQDATGAADLRNGLFHDRIAGGAGNTAHSSEITEVGEEGKSIGDTSHSSHNPSSAPPDKEPPTAAIDSSKDNAVAQEVARLSGLTDQQINLVSFEGKLWRKFKAPFSWMLKTYRGRTTAKYMLWLSDAETKLPQLRAFVANEDFTIAAGVEKRTWLGHLLFEKLGMVDRTREAYNLGGTVAPGTRLVKGVGGAVKSLFGSGSKATAGFGTVSKAWETMTTPYRWLSRVVHDWQVNRNTKFAGERAAWLIKYGTDGVKERFQNNPDIVKIVADHKKQVSAKEFLRKGAAVFSKPKTGTTNAVDGAHGGDAAVKGAEQTSTRM